MLSNCASPHGGAFLNLPPFGYSVRAHNVDMRKGMYYQLSVARIVLCAVCCESASCIHVALYLGTRTAHLRSSVGISLCDSDSALLRNYSPRNSPSGCAFREGVLRGAAFVAELIVDNHRRVR
jgi:hypothetical protein